MESKENDTNELIYKTETVPDIGNKSMLPKREGGVNKEIWNIYA